VVAKTLSYMMSCLLLRFTQNIIIVLVLLCLGFNWHFHDTKARLFLETTYLGSGFVRDGLIIMDLDLALLI